MKKSISLFLALACFQISFATTYYISADGNDANNGKSTTQPWQTLNKLNSYFKSLKAGDNVLLNRGDIFYGGIIATASGSSGSPITIGAYGSGSKPVITGFTTVSAWTSLSGNIWESSGAVSSLPYTNMVSVNGNNTAMGRYPNSGYLPITALSGSNSIISTSLAGPSNWAGAGIVIRKERWILERGTITAQSGAKLTYTDGNLSDAKVGYGFFIQNDSRTLDSPGEWYYNPSTKKIRVYSTSAPTSVKIATVENLISVAGYRYITLDNLQIAGANTDAVALTAHGSYVTVQSCDISFVGVTAVDAHDFPNVTVKNGTISNANYTAVGFIGSSHYCSVTNNVIKSVNTLAGMDQTVPEGAICTEGTNTLIQYNEIDSCGYSGIFPKGNNTNVKNNLVNTYCFLKDDGGGVYCSKDGVTGRNIDGNIILNGIGAHLGTPSTDEDLAGIFMDNNASSVTITNNTVANVSTIGIKLHDAYGITMSNNTVYNCGASSWQKGCYELLYDLATPVRNVSIFGNIFFCKTSEQLSMFTYTSSTDPNDVRKIGSADSNYYARPITGDADQINYQSAGLSWPGYFFDPKTWSTYFGQEKHSKGSPKSITSTDSLKFVYNASTSNQTINLDAKYIDVRGVNYNGSITLAPYTSAVLIRNGSISGNKSPVANAGPDITIALPVVTATLKGSGTDADGSISNYSWKMISGPAAANIISPASATTVVSGLVKGDYQFQLTVTDNRGAKGTATAKLTVKNASAGGNGLNYRYFEDIGTSYSYIPSYSYLVPVKQGKTPVVDISLANQATLFSMDFTGYINISNSGNYSFFTNSDDGSTLAIDGDQIVTNDGEHSLQEKSGEVYLKAGMHAIAIGYFQAAGGSTLIVDYQGPGIERQSIPNAVLFPTATQNLMQSNMALSQTNQVISNDFKVDIKVYPNPFMNSFVVNLEGLSNGYVKLLLYNVSGQLVWSKNTSVSSSSFAQTVDAANLERGEYLLKVMQEGNQIKTIKLIKQY